MAVEFAASATREIADTQHRARKTVSHLAPGPYRSDSTNPGSPQRAFDSL